MDNINPANSFASSLGNFGSSLFGQQPNALGGLGGFIGGFTPLGPIGAGIGSLLGNTIGGLFGFGAKKPEQLHYYGEFDPVADAILRSASNINGPANQEYVQGFNNYIMGGIDPVQALLQQLSVPVAPGNLSVGGFRGALGYGPGVTIDPTLSGENIYEGAHNVLDMGLFNTGNPGGRTDIPAEEEYAQILQALQSDLFGRSISGAGLTNADIFGRIGLPQDQAGLAEFLSGIAPNFSFGQNFDFAAPSQFTLNDVLAAQQLMGLSGQLQQGAPPPGGTGIPADTGNYFGMSDADFFSQAYGNAGANPAFNMSDADFFAQFAQAPQAAQAAQAAQAGQAGGYRGRIPGFAAWRNRMQDRQLRRGLRDSLFPGGEG